MVNDNITHLNLTIDTFTHLNLTNDTFTVIYNNLYLIIFNFYKISFFTPLNIYNADIIIYIINNIMEINNTMEINTEPYKCEIYFGIIHVKHTYPRLETLNLMHYLFSQKLKIYHQKKEINY